MIRPADPEPEDWQLAYWRRRIWEVARELGIPDDEVRAMLVERVPYR